jgi:hypothetical protein
MASLVTDNPFDTQQPAATNTSANTATNTANTGIVGGAMQQSAPTSGQLPSNVGTSAPTTPNAATYAPTTRQVDQTTGTVQGQVNSILSKDSPLMQRARTLATQQMAQRGLVNSSMAQGAGTAAMIDRATPIAAADANAYNQAASENANFLNASGQFNAGEINKFGLATSAQTFEASQNTIQRDFSAAQTALERAQQVSLTDKSIGAQQALQTAQQNFQGAQSSLDRAQQSSLQTGQQNFQAGQSVLDRTQQTSLQGLQQSFNAAQSELERAQQVALTDKSIGAQQALQTAQQNFQGQQAGMDRSLQISQQVSQQQFTANQSNIQNDFNMKVQTLQESGQDFRQARDIATREAMAKFAEMGVTNRFDQELALKSSQFNMEQYNLEKRQVLSNQMELDKLGLQIKATNANIPTTFAANISNTTMNGVNAVYAQPMSSDGKPTAAERQAQVQSLVNYANSQINWAQKFYGTTIPAITA